MYTDMQEWTDVRRAVLVEGISKRQACRRFGIHWQTLQRILEHPAPPGYQRTRKADRPPAAAKAASSRQGRARPPSAAAAAGQL